MQGKIPPWLTIAMIVVVVLLVGYFGYSQLKPPDHASLPPPPWIDPKTNTPRSNVGSGAPRTGTTTGN
jgi:hypothetical protein